MGYPILPPEPTCNLCPLCFPVDETPETMRVTFTGIGRGNLPAPDHPDPPNYTHSLSIIGACAWQVIGPTWEVNLYHDVPLNKTRLTLFEHHNGLLQYFEGFAPGTCNWVLSNSYQDPDQYPFIGGAGLAWWIGESDKTAVMYFADLFNIVPDAATHADQSTNDTDFYFTHINRLPDRSNIKAKISWP